MTTINPATPARNCDTRWAERYRGALRQLQEVDLADLRGVAVERHYRKGATIAEPKHGCGGIYGVTSGSILISKLIRTDKFIPVCHRRRCGDFFVLGKPDGSRHGLVRGTAGHMSTVIISVSWQEVLGSLGRKTFDKRFAGSWQIRQSRQTETNVT